MNVLKVLACSLALIIAIAGLAAQTPQWGWAMGAGGPNDESGWSITTDSQGNQYVTGFYYNTASFGAHSIASSGNADIFAAKLDLAGNWLWAVKAGGTGLDEGLGIAVDTAGNASLTGYFEGTVSFGTHATTSSGGFDIFAAKLSSGTPVDDDLHPPVASLVSLPAPIPFLPPLPSRWLEIKRIALPVELV